MEHPQNGSNYTLPSPSSWQQSFLRTIESGAPRPGKAPSEIWSLYHPEKCPPGYRGGKQSCGATKRCSLLLGHSPVEGKPCGPQISRSLQSNSEYVCRLGSLPAPASVLCLWLPHGRNNTLNRRQRQKPRKEGGWWGAKSRRSSCFFRVGDVGWPM